MALRLREVTLCLGEEETLLPGKVANQLNLTDSDILEWKIVRKGVDARRKPNVLRVYTIEFRVADQAALLVSQQDHPRLVAVAETQPLRTGRLVTNPRILVVGMGPAGLFAALQLAEGGAQVTLVERGKPISERLRDVRKFRQQGILNPESNVQFGEGGAGTFSDGKLTSRLNDPLLRKVLRTLVSFGAPEEILWQAKPHVGSDRLRQVLVNFRHYLLKSGVEINFSSRLTGLEVTQGRICGGRLDDSELKYCDSLVLAPGHSARDTYRMLQAADVAIEAKSFAVGLRVEHPRELINNIQYGMVGHPQLPEAEYSLAWNDPDTGRGTYSFCMCPGGWVVNAASEEGGLVVNGMSNYRRDEEFSNSALVVAVRPEDFSTKDPLGGIYFQQKWEQLAFQQGGGQWGAPAQSLLEFLGEGKGSLRSSCRPAVVPADLTECLPDFVVTGLRRAVPKFNQRMRGFVTAEATLIGVETRTSAPLRILRDRNFESIRHPGLFPAGEGAGYAGGIMSAAVDGIRVAQSILQRYQ